MKSLTDSGFFSSFFCGIQDSYQGFLATGFLTDAGRVVGFFELLLQGISTSLVLPKKSLVPWFSLLIVDGWLGRAGARDLLLQLGSDIRGSRLLRSSSDTEA